MKKLIYVFVLSLLAAPWPASASTCETRVDQYPGATTAERVKRCLEEESAPEAEPVTETTITQVYEAQYPKRKTKQQNEPGQQRQEKIYKAENVSLEFLDRDDYPAFRNDTLPSLSEESAHEAALEALRAKPEAPAKKTKPARKDKKNKPAKKQNAAKQPAPAPKAAQTDVFAGAESSVPQPEQTTPQTQIQQAQNLQNDPLYQDNTDGGAAPEGFTEDGVMGPDDFGYNATDPALQP